jgi:MFS family permease
MSVTHHLRLMWEIFREHLRILMSAGLGQLFAQTIRSGRQIVIPLYASEILGLDVQAVGWIVSAAAFVDMSLFYPAGWIMDRFGRKFAYVPSFIIQGTAMALVPFTGSFVALLGATCLLGFGNGLGSGTMMTLGADLAPEDSRGEFLGIWRLIGDGGQTGGPIVVGYVADLFSLPVAIFVIAGAGLMAALTLGVTVPETLHRSKMEAVRAAAD